MKKVLFICSLLWCTSCDYQVADELQLPPAGDAPGPSCDTKTVTYAAVIQPILSQNCGFCHSGAGASAGVRLDNHAGVKQVAQSGKLIGVITHTKGFPSMPQGGAKLSDCKIEQIQIWINAGLPNN